MNLGVKIAGGVLAAGALFGAGVVVAGNLSEQPDDAITAAAAAQVRAVDQRALSQIVAKAEQFETLTKAAEESDLSEEEGALIAVQIQQLGGSIVILGESLSTPEMQAAATKIGDGYIDVGVAVVLNEPDRMKSAISDINTATADLGALVEEYLGSDGDGTDEGDSDGSEGEE